VVVDYELRVTFYELVVAWDWTELVPSSKEIPSRPQLIIPVVRRKFANLSDLQEADGAK
jgi:hypothetical protein